MRSRRSALVELTNESENRTGFEVGDRVFCAYASPPFLFGTVVDVAPKIGKVFVRWAANSPPTQHSPDELQMDPAYVASKTVRTPVLASRRAKVAAEVQEQFVGDPETHGIDKPVSGGFSIMQQLTKDLREEQKPEVADSPKTAAFDMASPEQAKTIEALRRKGFREVSDFEVAGEYTVVMQKRRGPTTFSGEVEADGTVNGMSVEEFLRQSPVASLRSRRTAAFPFDLSAPAQTDFLSPEMEVLLNEQVAYEMYSAYLYFMVAAWCQSKGLVGFQAWFERQGNDEIGHAMKIYKYLVDTGSSVTLPPIPSPAELADIGSVQEAAKAVLDHEMSVTAKWKRIGELSKAEPNLATQQLAQWFMTEQVEEEDGAMTLLQKVQMADSGSGVLIVDHELKSLDPNETVK